ncbi:MAG: F0F1 ATP synthase subunit A [Chloroflexi bacterium]|nr:F0F1 ATP synthase subunit A [Chloroflexota bacterium]
MTNERTAEVAASRSNRTRNRILLAVAAVVIIDVLAALFVPPTPGASGSFQFPVDGITSNLEYPPPRVVVDLDPTSASTSMLQFHPSISSTILTSWIVMAIVLLVMILATRRMRDIPSRLQNVVEFAYESLEGFATSLGGPRAAAYVPLFAAFFLFILFSNWSGLIPPVGKLEMLRAPTSDVNITIGLALVSFTIFQVEGFRHLGVRGYLGKFFPLGEFRKGVGSGAIALFVGLMELLLEFVKPLTLSMRLFGNIFGGEVALAVITALTVAVIPVALVGLEVFLNAVQALIFSVLTLMFTLAAIEGHHDEEHPGGHDELPISTPVPHPTLERSAAS